LVGDFLTCSSSEDIIGEVYEDFFLVKSIISTDFYETVVRIIGVFVLSLIVKKVSYEITIGVIEESSLERSGISIVIDGSGRCVGRSGVR
jgi:hypothetical protein